MELPTPTCGNYDVHGKHEFWSHGPVWTGCPGWTQREADVKTLYETVWAFLCDHMAPRKVPEGTRLEIHPAAWYAWLGTVIPGYREFVSGSPPGFDEIPAVVTVAAESGTWCLRTDTETIAEGRIASAISA
jgi:hypothetical protein